MPDITNPLGRPLTAREIRELRRVKSLNASKFSISGHIKQRKNGRPQPITLRLPPEKR